MPVFGPNVTIPEDVAAAEWLRPRLGRFGTVGGLVPSGYETYLALGHGGPGLDFEGPSHAVTAAVASAAGSHTATPDRSWIAAWRGYGWGSGRRLISVLATARQRRQIQRADDMEAARLERELSVVPRFELPQREYYLLAGPVEAASLIERPGGRGLIAPDLWWPDDRSWFLATDVDLVWTYVGGTRAFAEAVAATSPFDVRPVDRSMWNSEVGGEQSSS